MPQSTTFTITTNQPIGDVSVTSNTSWLDAWGTGTTRTMSVTSNNTPSNRNGMITVSVGGVRRYIDVVQGVSNIAVTFNFGDYPQNEVPRSIPMGASFASAGQSLPMPPQVVWLHPITAERRGFIGWFKHSPGGSIRVDANTQFHANTRVYARWTNPDYHIHFWWPQQEVRLNLSNVPAEWRPYVEAGIMNWNVMNGTFAAVRMDDSATNFVEVYHIHRRLLAQFEPNPFPYPTYETSPIDFEIVLFRRNIEIHVERNYQGYFNAEGRLIASIMAHEIAHVFGLADGYSRRTPIGGHADGSLMNANRHRLSINTTQPIDIQNLNWIHR